MRIYAPLFFILTVGTTLSAQPLSIGVKGGISFNDPTPDSNFNRDESRPYIVGPSVEFHLPASFAIEMDALYQRVGSTQSYPYLTGVITGTTGGIPTGGVLAYQYQQRLRGNSWEFPLLGKYYFGAHPDHWQPFAGAGFAFRTVDYKSAGTIPVANSAGTLTPTLITDSFRGSLGVGAVFAAGARMHLAGHLSLTPEVRYTRWGSADGRLANNEARLLIGLTF